MGGVEIYNICIGEGVACCDIGLDSDITPGCGLGWMSIGGCNKITLIKVG